MFKIFRMAAAFLLLTALFVVPMGTASADSWYWLNSDSKYSKYFDPSSVVITHSAATSRGSVPTEIAAWTKTTYSYEGAQETIENYGLSALIPDPAQLSYSLAEVVVNPQNRTVQYRKEDFYDSQGKVIWSKTDGRVKEITSQQFDESFYTAIVDSVFGQGEAERSSAADRWITLWENTSVDGVTTHVTADTTTMRMKGSNMIVWQWAETKDANGNVMQIVFMKKAVNLPQGTERTVRAERWTPQDGWQELESSLDGAYRMIAADSPAYPGLEVLRDYAKNHAEWVNRYNVGL